MKADKVANAKSQTEDCVELLKTELGLRGLNLNEIEGRLMERRLRSDGTELVGAPASKHRLEK
jgi:hypothetical protein